MRGGCFQWRRRNSRQRWHGRSSHAIAGRPGVVFTPSALKDREIVRLSQDIEGILDGWEYEPDGLQVRIITGDDGTKKIQMRIDLGLIQMELDGRPDGQRPQGFPSLLDSYETKAKDAIDTGTPFSLSSEDCAS